MASGSLLKKLGSEGGSPNSLASESGSEDRLNPSRNSIKENGAKTSIRSDSSGRERVEYSGWVYHLGVNSIGHEYCHFRYLRIRGKYLEMYKRDPHDNPDIVRSSFPFFFFVLLFVLKQKKKIKMGLKFVKVVCGFDILVLFVDFRFCFSRKSEESSSARLRFQYSIGG